MNNTLHHPISYAVILADLVEEYQGDRSYMLERGRLSLDQLEQADALISDEQLQAMLTAAFETTNEATLALHYGKRLPITSHGVFGYALMSCKSLYQVLDLLMKYYRILLESAHLSLETGSQFVTIVYRNLNPLIAQKNFNEELLCAGIITAVQQLLHVKELPIQLKFHYKAPAHAHTYQEILGVEPVFGHHRNEIILSKDFLATQPEFANPAMLKIYQQQCDKLLANMEKNEGLETSIRRYLVSSQDSFPKLEKMAEHFYMSPRTFRRRLSDENTSFQKITDEVKRELAENYLRNPGFPIESVTHLLGFSDISNFRRAFIRWTGISPAEFQRTHSVTEKQNAKAKPA